MILTNFFLKIIDLAWYFLLKQKALVQANDAKAEGNKLFGAGQYEDALSQYAIALQNAPEVPSSSEIRSMCHANSAACFSKLVCHFKL